MEDDISDENAIFCEEIGDGTGWGNFWCFINEMVDFFVLNLEISQFFINLSFQPLHHLASTELRKMSCL